MTTIQKRESDQLLQDIRAELSGIRTTLDLVALSLAIGQKVRLLGGHVTEADVRMAAERRLRRIVEGQIPDPTRR
jgi:hypothetical protein